MSSWRSIPCNIAELRLNITLVCGQSFRWNETSPGEWTSVLHGHIWTLKQTDKALQYKVHNIEIPHTNMEKFDNIIKDYFQLDVNLTLLYSKWCEVDKNFAKIASRFTGIRILRQDPVENLFSFICSSNNNIKRISSMVEKLCLHYGRRLAEVDGVVYHAFPTVEELSGNAVENKLRDLGFGYRAKYINQTAKLIIKNHNPDWLLSLRHCSYDSAHQELIKLCGVGAKVADCVCLMSLNKHQSIPVDTHVWKIATNDYKMPVSLKTKTLTDANYKGIGNFFRMLWGDYAGWAQSVVFSADLKKFDNIQLETYSRKRKGMVKVSTCKPKNKKIV